jgi:DNA-binding transcriptional LysR family regulator
MDNERTLDAHLLRTFVSVVTERSVTRGAARLGISQPTASGHIKRLEDQLDAQLFNRSAPGIRLSATGELLLRHAEHVLRLNDELFRGIAEARSSKAKIRIGIPYEIRWNLLAALSDFSELNPGFELDIQRDLSSALAGRYRSGELDICAVVNENSLQADARYRWSETLFWAAAPAQAVPVARPVPVVAPPLDCLCGVIMIRTLDEAGVPYRIMLQAPDVEAAIGAAKEGQGVIALLTSNITRPLRALGAGSGLPALDQPYQWSICVNEARSSAVIERLAHIIAYLIAPAHVRIEGQMANLTSPPSP